MKYFAKSLCVVAGEKTAGKGEDSATCVGNGPNAVLIACADGCGGSGSRIHPQACGWTEARLASITVCEALNKWMEEKKYAELGTQDKNERELADEIRQYIVDELGSLRASLGAGDNTVSSRMIKSFPTTLSVVLAEAVKKNTIRATFFWAGDSRAYVFYPKGLRQVTRDDIPGGDNPLKNAVGDSFLQNYVQEGAEFIVHARAIRVEEPCMILTATDGCFSYFPSPILFEAILLETLYAVECPKDWEIAIQETVAKVADDDYTMILVVMGFESFPAIKTAYADRWQEFKARFSNLPKIIKEQDHERHSRLLDQYKETYYPDVV